MRNFGRALQLALRRRWTFAASVVCALMVGVLWGGNISAIYPFVEIAVGGRSLHEWVERKIETSQGNAADAAARIESLRGDPDAIAREQVRLDAANASLARYERLRPLVHRFLPNDAFQTLLIVVGLLLAGTLLKSLFLVAHSILVARLTQLATFNLRKQFYRRTLEMDLVGVDDKGASDLISRFTYDMDSLTAGVETLFGKLVREPLKMLACLIGAGFICWRLLLMSLIAAPLAALLIRRLARALKRANRRAMEDMSQIYNLLVETLQGMKIVKAFTMERHERLRFHHRSKNFFLRSMRIARYDSLTRPLTEVMGIATICLALLAGAYLVLEQETHLFGIRMSNEPLDFPALLLFYGLLAGVSDPARKLSEVFSRLQRAAAAADRIYQTMDAPPRLVDPAEPKFLVRHHRDLVFQDIHFSYTPGLAVLEGVNLEIACGETVALVGPNGCGKTTLANLIPRFFDPTTGLVLLDGVDLREVRRRDLRRQIGLVNQDTMLFDDTVLNNIRYGSPLASREQAIEAAKQAHAHRFITERLADGYETIVGAGGSQLSGGQRQRIALARAILRDPAILILDEATSQVDLESEQVIQRVLEQFIRNRTTVIITHRLGLLALADRIVVMEAGRVLDVGAHDELLHRSGTYRRLHDIQFREIA